MWCVSLWFFFFFNDTATTEIYTLSLHDALPISAQPGIDAALDFLSGRPDVDRRRDRKSTRLNSSHEWISYAVFCLKKNKNKYVIEPNQNHRIHQNEKHTRAPRP